jgi:hypothetical protein
MTTKVNSYFDLVWLVIKVGQKWRRIEIILSCTYKMGRNEQGHVLSDMWNLYFYCSLIPITHI